MFGLSTTPLVILDASVTVQDVGNGQAILVCPDGQVMSLQPTDPPVFEKRPAGTDGPYERCTVKDGAATYNPTGPSGKGYVYALRDLPNG